MNRRGFTLIEVLIAISILMVIVLVLYASFSSVTNTMEMARVSSEEMRLRLFLERSFRANFSSVYADRSVSQEVYRFVGEDAESLDGPNDNVRFVSINTLMGGAGLPGDLKEVRYGTVGGDESEINPIDFQNEDGAVGDNQRKLEAVETPLFGANVQELDPDTGYLKPAEETGMPADSQDQYETPSWSVPIRTVDFSYFDGVNWVDEWDSQVLGRFPWCVRIRINFARTEDQLEEEKTEGLDIEDNPDFEMVIPLPAGLGGTQDARTVEGLSQMGDEATADPNNPGAAIGGDPRDPNEQGMTNVQINYRVRNRGRRGQ